MLLRKSRYDLASSINGHGDGVMIRTLLIERERKLLLEPATKQAKLGLTNCNRTLPDRWNFNLSNLSKHMDQETIAELVGFANREELRYQQIPGLPQNNSSDRSYINDHAFAGQVRNSKILDIGSNLGYFCLEAVSRGMKQAVGIETDPENVRKSNEIARILNLKNITIINGDFETTSFDNQKFGVILCLNVLHHFFDPISAIRKIISLADDRIVIEFAVPTILDVIRRRISLVSYISSRSPSIVLGVSRLYTDGSRTFLFSPKAMRVLFDQHHAGFDRVKIQKSPFKGRYVLVAVRRKIGHLVVVAGLNAAGKSTLISKLKSEADLRAQCGMENGDWPVADASSQRLPDGEQPTAIFHYDLLHAFGRSARTIDRDVSVQLLKHADRVTILTLATPLPILKQRLTNEIAGSWRKKKRQRRILENYSKPGFTERWINEWFEVCTKEVPEAQHMTVMANDHGGYEFLESTGLKSYLEQAATTG